MIADISITEKSYGDKTLMTGVKFSIDDGEKVGLVGRNGAGKSTLFGLLAGTDTDYTGDIIYRKGLSVVATAQEHHDLGEQTVLQYILGGLPEYPQLSHIIETYPARMGDDMRLIEEYSNALERFEQKGFYQIESDITRELETFQLPDVAHRPMAQLSGGQKRLVEVVKIMHAQAGLALIDEPTNHMDYVAKAQFIDWLRAEKTAGIAMLVITHDRDVLQHVDRIIELRDGTAVSYRGNYDAYLKQNAARTSTGMNDYEMVEKRMTNLRQKIIDYQRLKEKSRNPSTIQKFKRLESVSRAELAELEAVEKPTFWIDRESVEQLDYKAAGRYQKFKSKNIRMNIKDAASRSKHVLVRAADVSLGYGAPLFSGVNIDLREGEAVELRGRNGAGKSTLIKALLSGSRSAEGAPRHTQIRQDTARNDSLQSAELAALKQSSTGQESSLAATGNLHNASKAPSANLPGGGETASPTLFAGELALDPHVRVGVYEQEVSPQYFELSLHDAIERTHLDRDLSIGETKIRQLMSDYLFTEADGATPVARLSGGQKARLQIIAMLANDPQLLILDEPTNHLDLPSIEELETALQKYTGAILYVSHDSYFASKIGGEVVAIGGIRE